MATIRNTIPKLYDPQFDEVFQEAFAETPTFVDTLFDVREDTSKSALVGDATGLGLWSTAAETEALTADMPIDRFQKTFTHVKFRKGVNVSFEAVEDDEVGAMSTAKDDLLSMGRQAAATVDRSAAAIFTGAFGTTTTADGQALCSNNHPLAEKGLTSDTGADNLLSGALTHDNLSTAETQISDNMTDDRGLPALHGKPSILLVPASLKDEALRIVASRATLRPDTADNDINVHAGNYQVVVWPTIGAAFGGSNTAWFLVAPKMGLRWYWRLRPEFRSWVNEQNESFWFGGRMRYSVGAYGWRGVWGSTGL